MSPTFDEIYAEVPAAQRDALAQFRTSHPPQSATVDGETWEYLEGGSGDETVLLLVGGLRVADAAYRSMPMLEDEFRVLTPTYPALPTMTALADGLAGVLDAAGVERASVLAGSFGGMLAQVLVRRHPARVKRLVLSTTAVLNAENADRYRTLLGMVQATEETDVLDMAKTQMFDTIAPPEDMHNFYRAYLDELYSQRLKKPDLVTTYEALLDYADNHTFTTDDLNDWDGEVLILESDDDATFDADTRAAVRALYPKARTFTFHGAGHSPGTTQRDLYFRVVKAFLRDGTVT
jgi:pimeloyl-ACP methyl ester carboxylesterase